MQLVEIKLIAMVLKLLIGLVVIIQLVGKM